MGKTRVHLLAKELGMETKDLIAQLDRLGIRGRKAQSSLEDEEVSRVRSALAAHEKPQVHVGEEKVVADRVVKAEDESLGEIQARETVVERRVRANVIRRRTSRVEVVSQAAEEQPVQPEADKVQPQIAKEVAEVPGPESQESVHPPISEEEIFTSLEPAPESEFVSEEPVGGPSEVEGAAPIEGRAEEQGVSRLRKRWRPR
jgi:hypothetical protein